MSASNDPWDHLENQPEIRTTSESDVRGDSENENGVFSAAFKAKLRALLAARDAYAVADEARKNAKAALDDIELDVYEVFEGLGVDGEKISGTIPVPLGPPYGTVKFRTRETHYAKIADEDKLLEYLNARAITEEIVAPKFAKARLNEMVREVVDNPDAKLPPGLTYYTDRGMTITRQKG